MKGGPGNDRITTKFGWDESVRGGPGDDLISALTGGGIGRGYGGGRGRDTLHLGGHGDIGVILTADGDHLIIHEEGYYLLSFWSSRLPVAVNLAAGTIRHIGAPATGPVDTITYRSRKSPYFSIYGSRWDDHITSLDRPAELWHTIYGAEGDDTLVGLSSVDYIDGAEGNDTLYGGDNDDGLQGGPGNDVLDGGAGDDEADGGLGIDTCLDSEVVNRCSP